MTEDVRVDHPHVDHPHVSTFEQFHQVTAEMSDSERVEFFFSVLTAAEQSLCFRDLGAQTAGRDRDRLAELDDRNGGSTT